MWFHFTIPISNYKYIYINFKHISVSPAYLSLRSEQH